MSLLAYLFEVVLGPVGLVLNLGDLQVLLNDAGSLLSMVTAGELSGALEAVLAGEYATSGHLVANAVGTLLWLAVLGALFEGLGDVGELAELGELLD